MAINATIHKVTVNIADIDRHYYQDHELTVAQHPSETDLRFMIRVIAFILNAHENLHFTQGLCNDDEPELWQKSLTDEIELWIDLGQPDEKRIRKASSRAQKVKIYTYHERKAKVWREHYQKHLNRFTHLSVCHIQAEGLESLAKRSMQLQCTIQDGALYLTDEDTEVLVTLQHD